ncbi:MAG: SDR family NAD(P)-dependent oxidoreductase [Rhodobacteraceae bacterium]|nr:SDR family NAD(P)-dependent oxidoreductase [Paracoccaceae bacterium]
MPLKTALITGGGSGIGRAATLALARDGYLVAIAGRHIESLRETAAGAEDVIRPIAADVTDAGSVESLFQTVMRDFGRLDLLFNNAGVGAPPVPLEDLSEADWRRCVDTNLTGTFLCTQQAIRIMKTQTPMGGRIINNGSVSAYSPRPNTAAYTATKHAISGLTKSISLDGRAHDIACSQLDIGNADSDMAAKFKTGVPQASGDIRREPVFDLEHCGNAVAFMAGLPLDTNIQFMTIMATKMPFIGRG